MKILNRTEKYNSSRVHSRERRSEEPKFDCALLAVAKWTQNCRRMGVYEGQVRLSFNANSTEIFSVTGNERSEPSARSVATAKALVHGIYKSAFFGFLFVVKD